jgi:phosphoribosylformylglycinamidine cyclo-ligase
VLLGAAGWPLERHVGELGRTLGEELLEPTRIYAVDVLAVLRDPAVDVHALSHVTGGGIAANLDRVLPGGLTAVLDRAAWSPPPVFGLVAAVGGVERAELERTLNQGVGMCVVVPASGADVAARAFAARGVPCWVLGTVRRGEEPVSLVGEHPS